MIFVFSILSRLARPLAMIYLTTLALLLLYPFQFSSPFVSRTNSVTWQGADGVAFGASGILLSAEPPVDL
jgi:hypothetical protein